MLKIFQTLDAVASRLHQPGAGVARGRAAAGWIAFGRVAAGLVAAGLVGWAALASAARAQDADAIPRVRQLDIVDRAIAHHGGDRYADSATRLELCSKSGCTTVFARVDAGRYRYAIARDRRSADGGATVREVLTMTNAPTDAVTRMRDGAMAPVDDPQRVRDTIMARVYFPFLPHRLNDPSVWKQDLGVETWPTDDGGARRLHRVRVGFDVGSSTDADDVYHYWFDADTAELVQFAYVYDDGHDADGRWRGGGLRFRRLVNARTVGGLRFADQINLGTEWSTRADALAIDALSPSVVDGLRAVSTITLDAIRVADLADASTLALP
ncbi:MAG: hypothetical protein AAF772_07780 [Acidobacteriota bacterium]